MRHMEARAHSWLVMWRKLKTQRLGRNMERYCTILISQYIISTLAISSASGMNPDASFGKLSLCS